MPKENAPSDRPETHAERRQERLQAKDRGLTVEQWRERKAANQARWRAEQTEKLNTAPFKMTVDKKLAVNGKVEVNAWEERRSSVLDFIKAAYLKAGVTDPEVLNQKARAVQNQLIRAIGDDYLAMTSAAMIRFDGSTFEAVGLHSNKYGKRVEEIVAERQLSAQLDAAERDPLIRVSVPENPSPSVSIVGDSQGVRLGAPRAYNPADDGLVQRGDGTWVSDGSNPKAGKDTRKPASL